MYIFLWDSQEYSLSFYHYCVFVTKRLVVFVYVYSIGDIQKSENGPFGSVKWEPNTRKMLWFWLFAGLWTNAFIMAINQFILASTAAIWYFSPDKNQVHRPVSRSIYRAIRYHLGSLAFGSLLLAIVKIKREREKQI